MSAREQRKKERRAASRARPQAPPVDAEPDEDPGESDGYYDDGTGRLKRAARKAREQVAALGEQFGYDVALQVDPDYFEKVAAEFPAKVADEYARAAQHELERREKWLARQLERRPTAALERQHQIVQAAYAALRDPAIQMRLLVKVQHLGADPGWRRLLADIIDCSRDAAADFQRDRSMRPTPSPLTGVREGSPALAARVVREMAPYMPASTPAIFKPQEAPCPT